jgi:CHAT domain-containing protein
MFGLSAAERLSDHLVRPVMEELERKRLVIVADGALQYIPFSALPDPRLAVEPGESRPPLVHTHRIVYLPSASALAALRKDFGDRVPAPERIAVIADPVFSTNDPRLEAPLPRDPARAVRDAGLDGRLPRLPFTQQEAETIRALIPDGQRLEILGFDASRDMVTGGELARYRILHFATHGFLDPWHPELSGIVLSMIDRQGKPIDGFLRSYDICNLDLNADLAVLSTCKTDSGSEIGGEGLVGLARSFMYAGVPRVLMSLWNVSDRSTAELMCRFYKGLIDSSLPPVDALRCAQLSMAGSRDFADPYQWAGFILQGDWAWDESIRGGIEAPPPITKVPVKSDNSLLPMNSAPQAELSLREMQEARWWGERYGRDDPQRGPIMGIDPKDLSQAGWGVIWGPGVSPEIRDALKPLLDFRLSQTGPLFKSFTYQSGVIKQDFLAANGARPGPVQPHKVPYYLLLVGDPLSIPFRFQYELDVQYAVGRLHFETPAEYESYARSVVAVENRRQPLLPKHMTFFAPSNSGDEATWKTSRDLVRPLREVLAKGREEWTFRMLQGEEARKPHLGAILGGGETPALLFTASHGMRFDEPDERLLSDQGALLCQEWPGPYWGGAIPQDFYFSAADVGDRSILGLIAFLFACHSAGTPELADFDAGGIARPQKLAKLPFISRLPQRLLGHPKGGALAVLGHIERAWTLSFNWTEEAQIEIFESILKLLLEGYPVGFAMESINQRYAELSVELSGLLIDQQRLERGSKSRLNRIWQAHNDARNFVVLGDPAVRLAV